jgi:acetyl-CoA carboxylase biotin carboxyl carrier protein
MTGLTRADIDDIIRLVEGSHFDELRLEMGDLKIELRRGDIAPTTQEPAGAPFESAGPTAAPDAAQSEPAGAKTDAAPTTEASPATRANPQDDTSIAVPAPLLGTFYHAPKPGDDPFIQVGDPVTPDTVIGIIEVMKLMNSVTADVAGVVTEVVAPNGELVEFGDTLIRVGPA